MVEERVYFKGRYYRRIGTDHSGVLKVDDPSTYDLPCAGCCFYIDHECSEPEAPCLATGCGPTSIFKEAE